MMAPSSPDGDPPEKELRLPSNAPAHPAPVSAAIQSSASAETANPHIASTAFELKYPFLEAPPTALNLSRRKHDCSADSNFSASAPDYSSTIASDDANSPASSPTFTTKFGIRPLINRMSSLVPLRIAKLSDSFAPKTLITSQDPTADERLSEPAGNTRAESPNPGIAPHPDISTKSTSSTSRSGSYVDMSKVAAAGGSMATGPPENMILGRLADDDLDHVGSNNSTPPGVATPRPDLTDKRLPGILHNYFGQVRDDSNPRTSHPNGPASLMPAPNGPMDNDGQPTDTRPSGTTARVRLGGDELPTAPSSPREMEDTSAHGKPPLLPHERAGGPHTASSPALGKLSLEPTPPTSSSPSFHWPHFWGRKAKTGSAQSKASDIQAPQGSGPAALVMRRTSAAEPSPLSNVVTAVQARAAHLSSPVTRLPSMTSAGDNQLLANLRAMRGASETDMTSVVTKLTDMLAKPASSQNTPPLTPRTQSQGSTTVGSSSLARQALGAPSMESPKGKLSVVISEARGLTPSVDPYVVCQFQWSEYVSEGPQSAEMALQGGATKDAYGGLLMRRTDSSDKGRPMAIPMKSRQSSNNGIAAETREAKSKSLVTDPQWGHNATFDVVGEHSEIDVSVYDRSNQEAFLGHVRFCPHLVEFEQPLDAWFTLEPRDGDTKQVTGEIHLMIRFERLEKRHLRPNEFEILKLIGKGTFGQVFQVRKRDTKRIYAMKVLSKKVIVQKKEVAHTLGERNILVRTSQGSSPFIVGLKFSFQTPSDLYLVTDFMSGGELFWHLQKEGRFHEARAKFYIAELILALEHLHKNDVVYRDLKPENILLDANGHIALCDFGLSKANLTDDSTTNTFCGTTEYLAPEVLLDETGYTKMVDFWSLGVLVFEMCCGWSPFYAEDTQQMYKNIAFGKVKFPRDALSPEGRSFVKGLLNRNPKHRLGCRRDASELKEHEFFADIDWDALSKKNVTAPFKPQLKSELDTSNFDPEFTNALHSGSLNARAQALVSGLNPASTPLSPTIQEKFKGFTFVGESSMEANYRDRARERGQDLDRMDEGDQSDDDWEKDFGGKEPGDRMSGIVTEHDADEPFFQ